MTGEEEAAWSRQSEPPDRGSPVRRRMHDDAPRVLLDFGIAEFRLGHAKRVLREGRVRQNVDCVQPEGTEGHGSIEEASDKDTGVRPILPPTLLATLVNEALDETPAVISDLLDLIGPGSLGEEVLGVVGEARDAAQDAVREGEGQLAVLLGRKSTRKRRE